jgi:predicted RND superfamily exporter protein
VKFAKQGFYRGDPSFYSLPTQQERNFIYSYLPKRGETDLSMLNAMTDSTGQIARISLQVADLGTAESRALQDEILSLANEIFPKERYDIGITGASMIFVKGTTYLIKNLIISLLLAVVVITIIMTLLFRSFAMVIVSLIPNLFPLLLTAGIMGWFGIPLKPSTILVFSVAFGISVDDTIHFLAKYRQELRASNWNIGRSVVRSLREVGVSMFYTSIILFFGFSVFIASDFGGTVSLGILVSVTLVIAMLSNLIILPSLLLSLEKLVLSAGFNHPLITLYKPDDDDDTKET